MSYYKDLSPYEYFSDEWQDTTLNVGWLNARHPFPEARPSAALLDRIWKYCRWSINQTRGCHMCEMCGRLKKIPFGPTEITHQGATFSLGSAEIRVFGQERKIYAAPNLIFHYMIKHHYEPPGEFVKAVMRGPCPPSAAYFKRLQGLNFEWMETFMPLDIEGRLRRLEERRTQPGHPGLLLPEDIILISQSIGQITNNEKEGRNE